MVLEEGVSVRIGRKTWRHEVPDHLLTPDLKKIISERNEKQIEKALEAEELNNEHLLVKNEDYSIE